MGLGSIAKTFDGKKLFELAKNGGLMLVGYAVGNLAGKAVANAVNKNEQNPQGLKKYINALTQGTIAAVCVSMGGKRTWLKNVGMGAALSAVQTTVETISGKSVLDMLSFGNKTATNGVEGLGDGSTDLILPPLEGTDDDPIEGADDDPIEGADDDPIEGADDDPIEGADDDPIEGADDEDEGISGNDEEDFDGVDDDDFDGIDNDYDDGISGEDYE